MAFFFFCSSYRRAYPHLVNAGKYLCSIMATISSKLGVVFFFIMNTISTIYSLYWDFIEDWGISLTLCWFSLGLLHNTDPYKPKFLLRNRLLYSNKLIYYFIILYDLFGRTAWIYKYFLVCVLCEERCLGFFYTFQLAPSPLLLHWSGSTIVMVDYSIRKWATLQLWWIPVYFLGLMGSLISRAVLDVPIPFETDDDEGFDGNQDA